jgi:hypothetical protein
VVATVMNAVLGYSGRATMVWQLFNWSSGLSENLQGLIQIAAVVFGLVVFAFVAELFWSRLDPDWIYYLPLAEENERKRQERLAEEARNRQPKQPCALKTPDTWTGAL